MREHRCEQGIDMWPTSCTSVRDLGVHVPCKGSPTCIAWFFQAVPHWQVQATGHKLVTFCAQLLFAGVQALHDIVSLSIQQAQDAVFASPKAIPALVRLMLWPACNPSKHRPAQQELHEQGLWGKESLLAEAFSAKPHLTKSQQLAPLQSSVPAQAALQTSPGAAADVTDACAAQPPNTTAGAAATGRGQPAWPPGTDKTVKGSAKAPKLQRQRAAWLSRHYMHRMSVAAQHAAAILGTLHIPVDSLSMHSADLIAAAMGAGEGLAGGLSVAESAAQLLSSMRLYDQ